MHEGVCIKKGILDMHSLFKDDKWLSFMDLKNKNPISLS